MEPLRFMGRPRSQSTVCHIFRSIEISLYPRKRGDWEAGFTIPGQERDKATGPSERECRDAAIAKIRSAWDPVALEARRDEDRARDLLGSSGVTLTESARFYLAEHRQAEFSGTVAQLRDRWLVKVRTKNNSPHYHHHRSLAQCSSHLIVPFGDRQISTITLAQLTNHQDELEMTRSARTMRNIHDANKALWGLCA